MNLPASLHRTVPSLHRLPLLLLPVLSAAVLLWGSVPVSAADVWDALCGNADAADSAGAYIVLHARLPQLWGAVLCGSALSAAGLVMQTVFANPLADPSLLGVNSGAGLGAACALLLTGGTFAAGGFALSGYLFVMLSALAGALAVIFLLTVCSALLPGRLHLLVAGVMLSFAVSSLISVLNSLSTAQGVRSFVIWGMGDFSGVTPERLPVFGTGIAIGLLLLIIYIKPLDALLLGETYARNLGIRVRHSRTMLLVAASLLCAVPTALCGPISFIGIAAPHVARLTSRTAGHARLLPASVLWGADFALLAAILTRLPGGQVLPLNAVTPLLGVPVVFYLLLRRRN